jgi:hypothetical protein
MVHYCKIFGRKIFKSPKKFVLKEKGLEKEMVIVGFGCYKLMSLRKN